MTRLPVTLAMLATLTLLPWSSEFLRVSAAEPDDCPAGDGWISCRAEKGDPLAIYLLAREAYDAARESGDYTEALRQAVLADKASHRHGKKLLKMIYIQLGQGEHRDAVQAYRWLSAAMADGVDYLEPWLNRLAKKMSPEQLAQAKRREGE